MPAEKDRPGERKILLIGLGDLGSTLLEFLARESLFEQIIVASRSLGPGLERCNLARISALAHGFNPSIEFHQIDLHNVDQTATLIHQLKPDLLISTATLQTWWLSDLLPEPQSRLIKQAGFGVWLPVHFVLTSKLMAALNNCQYRGFSLTAPFPDVVNVILSRLGLAPTCGVGNVDEIIPKIRIAVSERLDIPIDQIEVDLVAHHALQKYCLNRQSMNSESEKNLPPFHLRVTVDHQDITPQLDTAEILFSAFPITSGPASHFLTAGSTMRLLKAFCSSEKRKRHVPAPGGMPGGYPVWVSDEGCKIRSVSGLSLNQAVEINEKSHQFDGIEKIEVDGTVRIAAEPAEIMRETLGYDCNSVSPSEMEDRADELMKRFKGLAESHGIPLERMKFGR